jgi:hypothetical protein
MSDAELKRQGDPVRSPKRRSATPAAVIVGTLFCLSSSLSPARAADQGEPIFAAAREAVAKRRIGQTPVLGFHDQRKVFTELPAEGAILIGFDLGVGKFFDIDTVYALRPIYRTAWGETAGRDHGMFRDRWLAPKKVKKTKVLRTVNVRARPGYAVGSITLRSGLNINGLSVTFQRITGRTLDPERSYESAWIGDRTGGSEKVMSSNGAPVVGVCGSADEEHIKSLGLFFVNQPVPVAVPPVAPVLKEQPPEKPVEPVPAKQPAEAVPVEKPAEPPPVEKVAEPPPTAPQAERRPDPPKKTEEREVPPPVDPLARREKEQEGKNVWIPLVIFGTVAMGVFLALFLSSGRKEKIVEVFPIAQDPPKTKKSPEIPYAIAVVPPDSTGICERPGNGPSRP